MNELQIFSNPDFGKIRIVEVNGEPWLVGKDVAMVLGYGEGKSLANAVANHVDAEDKGVTELMTPGGKQKMIIINESGLYSLVLSSKLPTAKRFRHWVTSEVLPSIRRSGSYVLSKKESEQIRRLQELQDQLQNWKQLESKFSEYTTRDRKAYETDRAYRDECRNNIGRLELLIADLIGQLNQMPQIR